MSTQKENGRTLKRLCWHNNDEFWPEKKFVSEGEGITKEKWSNFCHKQQNNSHSVCSLRTLQQKKNWHLHVQNILPLSCCEQYNSLKTQSQ